MMMKFAVTGLAMMAGAAGVASAAGPIEGNWVNPSRTVTVHIGPCGRQLCGRVVSASAKAKGDAAAAGTAQLVGTLLISEMEPDGEGSWNAQIFVPDRNIHAQGEIHLTGPRTLDIQGCMGGLFCKTQTWVKVASPVKRKR